ncbi:siphovirus Gp157 family protein [Streptococcus sp. NLN76]|uniref:siphovirus Gp157 family protein n=1 Tax=Streptococcus sp. NLN76 TaxID=2822800 RepID=UPI0018A98970|nr:siphovirus Gp157 family protein [Streptococcus sp. NLN76]MBF8970189.1 siphovirus Gp157 family protein [Streptococcus sp. NLN76]
MNMYSLVAEYEFLRDYIPEDGEEDLLESRLKELNDAIEVKAENIAKVLLEEDVAIDGIDKEIKRLKEFKESREKKKKKLKSILFESMIKADKRKFKTELFSFNIRKNAQSLLIESEKDIPDEYFKEKTEIKLDKRELLADMKEGLVIDGVSLQRTESLVIR